MVEPPIKKADRQQQPNADIDSQNPPPKPTLNPNFEPPIKAGSRDSKPKDKNSDRDRKSGKGKRSSSGDESKPPVSAALARGPKPVKPPVKTEVESEETTSGAETEPVSEASEG
ncbi:hypothetical protein [Calothrix sp. PCC 6303]|uniref:hypothetical protein n=1 Tax=Calothrix sp. PCC 6303 TaxID=1170562 RepID=UPI0002A0244D|nr:hypothetical protein [Calothrix sp. PCC 6303]AFZ04027.1 hypothetical protein Cal6303_5139 [Calothrix sp. PCC 6303]